MTALGQEHVVDSGIDGGDLGGEVAPDRPNLGMHETPHPEEDADSRDYRCDGVWTHADSVADYYTQTPSAPPVERFPRPSVPPRVRESLREHVSRR